MIKIIADSGGTKTDFCIIENGQKEVFSRPSYRVDTLIDDQLETEIRFWKNKLDQHSLVRLRFFGAGCLSKDGNNKQRNLLLKLGFNDFSVQSDLHLAGMAAYGKKSGFVAIMGTGSVIFYWNGTDVNNVYGGKGYLTGDEGSGFYFGKLVLMKYLEGVLNAEQSHFVEGYLNPKQRSKETVNEKELILKLSSVVSSSGINFESVHQENIQILFDDYIVKNKVEEITIIGGYGFHQKKETVDVLSRLNVKKVQFVEKPIRSFIE